MMSKPPENQLCNGCKHPFGVHYSTYNMKQAGCSHYDDNQRDGGPCFCKGFSMTWTPEHLASWAHPSGYRSSTSVQYEGQFGTKAGGPYE